MYGINFFQNFVSPLTTLFSSQITNRIFLSGMGSGSSPRLRGTISLLLTSFLRDGVELVGQEHQGSRTTLRLYQV